jgi:hypothetical protein
VNSTNRKQDNSDGTWRTAFAKSGSEHHERENKDSELLIKHPAPDSSPSAVSSGTYSEGKIRR